MADPAGRVYLQVLVVRCQLGDRDAFAEMVALCQPRLRAFLHKMLPRPHQVDDVAQDVWMDVYRDLPGLIQAAAFLPWLYRIAHNRCTRTMRQPHPALTSLEELDVAHELADEVEFTADDAEVVHAAMSQLSDAHREVLLLRFLEDMGYDEIANVLQCPVGTVRSRIHNAKSALRQILEQSRPS